MRLFETLVTRLPYHIQGIAGGSEDLVIAFASIGHDPSRAPSPEFVRSATARDRSALFVMDEARSWATAEGFADTLREALEALQARQKITRILAIGSSMGAFVALRAAQTLPLTAVLAISPQYQPAASWETRWRAWTYPLPEALTAPLPQGPYLCLMHGLQDDAHQSNLFPPQKGCDHILFADQAHATLAAHLKTRGLVEGLIDATLEKDRRRLLRILQGAGGQKRQLPR
jgi:pimeloyl-ACP methyl ester carboxylesterase